MSDLAQILTDFFQDVPHPVVLHEPHFGGNELNYVKECIDTGWVSSVGSYVDRYEEELGAYTNAHAVLTANGTSALHLALILSGIEPGDEVLVSDLTFVATANAVSYCYATPHFVEVEEGSFAVDPEKLEIYLEQLDNKPKALIVTHVFGHPAPIKALQNICDKHGIILIEDAAESLGSTVGNQHTGTFGTIAALSFNGNKTITTGGGGALLTTDKALAERAKHLSTTAKVHHLYHHVHDMVGYNYRMPNINAALGCAQLEQLPKFLEQKKQLAHYYKTLFQSFEDVRFVDQPPETNSNCWLNTIVMPSEEERNALIDNLAAEQIFCRGIWAPMSSLPMYQNCPRMETPIAQNLCARSLNLPSSACLINTLRPL